MSEKEITTQACKDLIMALGVTPNLKGYNYIVSAIKIISTKKQCKITKDVYPTVAKEYETTSSRVERAIRHAINKANLEVAEEIFCVKMKYYGKLSNSEFLYLCVEELRRDIF